MRETWLAGRYWSQELYSERTGALSAGDQWWRDHEGNPAHWHPSIFMPRWASRLTLEITAVRAERLQDITEEDAKAEGLSDIPYMMPGEEGVRGFGPDSITRPRFRALWDSLNAKRGYGWDANPWAWVIEFRRLP